MKKVLLPLILLIAALAPQLASHLWAQQVDASHLDTATPIEVPWRFHAGDDPANPNRFTDPAFDDSSWPLVKPEATFASVGLPNVSGGSLWLRLHVKNASIPLGTDLNETSGLPFEVYANGRQIAQSPGWSKHANSYQVPFAIALPRDPSLVLTFHVIAPTDVIYHRSPIGAFNIGPLRTIIVSTDYTRLVNFSEAGLSELIEGLVFLVFSVVAFLLFYAQRNHREYLWLGLLMVTQSILSFTEVSFTLGELPVTFWSNFLQACVGFSLLAFTLRFVMTFSNIAFRPIFRILEVLILIGPFATASSRTIFNTFDLIYLILCVVFTIIAILYCLIEAYRRGRAESGLLVPPLLVSGLISLANYSSQLFPSGVRVFRRIELGHIALGMEDLGAMLLLAGFFLVVFLRFLRVNREQQQAEAEFEAARTVQQVLIPDDLPEIAGLHIESVYRPAQQVGGDFFQIIPAPDGAAIIVLGDVAGKGMQAAMTVSLLVGTIRTEAEHTSSPATLMETLNRRSHGRTSSFTTCLILHVARSGEVTAANAGHLQPYLAGHEIALESGLPLGFDPTAEYTETHFILEAGMTLTLLTDGVVEATNIRKELFGFSRTEAISTNTAQAIAEEAHEFGMPAPQADDITVLTLTRHLLLDRPLPA